MKWKRSLCWDKKMMHIEDDSCKNGVMSESVVEKNDLRKHKWSGEGWSQDIELHRHDKGHSNSQHTVLEKIYPPVQETNFKSSGSDWWTLVCIICLHLGLLLIMLIILVSSFQFIMNLLTRDGTRSNYLIHHYPFCMAFPSLLFFAK